MKRKSRVWPCSAQLVYVFFGSNIYILEIVRYQFPPNKFMIFDFSTILSSWFSGRNSPTLWELQKKYPVLIGLSIKGVPPVKISVNKILTFSYCFKAKFIKVRNHHTPPLDTTNFESKIKINKKKIDFVLPTSV